MQLKKVEVGIFLWKLANPIVKREVKLISDDLVDLTKVDWYAIDWQTAQQTVVEFFHQNGFMSFHERRSPKGRLDGLVVKSFDDKAVFGVVEVKHYQKVSPALVKSALRQAYNYALALKKRHATMGGNIKAVRNYFVAVVFTKDFPVTQFSLNFPQSEDILVLYTSPLKLEHVLKKCGLIDDQQGLEVYLDPPPNDD